MSEPYAMQEEARPLRPRRPFISLLLTTLLGLVFLISGISKLFTMEALEWALLDLGIPGLNLAGLGARLLIGGELVLGGLLILRIKLKSFTLPLTLLILVVFIGYLTYLYGIQGGQESCGCFGDWIELTPWQSLGKNLVMAAITLYLLRGKTYPSYRGASVLGIVILVAGMATPFIVDPYFWNRSAKLVFEPIDLDPLYEEAPMPSRELREGQHILAFLSLNCGHCHKAAFRLQALYRQHPSWPIYFILVGPEESIEPFFEQTHSEHVPHYYMEDLDTFITMAGPAVPAIYWVRDGIKERAANYGQLDPLEIQDWLDSFDE